MKNLLYIGNKLSTHGITVTSIETLGLLLENEGYQVKYASSQRSKLLRLAEMIFATLRYARKTDYVLIDTYSTYNFWYAFTISQLCRLLRLKYIPKLHGGNLPNRLAKNPMLCRMIFKHAYKNIAPSDYLLKAFENRGYAELVYIPNTIEIQNYEFKMRHTLRPKLLWVRSLSSIYNPDMALKVLAEVKKEFPDAELCMVGPDKENILASLQQLANEWNLKVDFTGKLSKSEWGELSTQYDIFINTTHFDNTPVSIIEAMALGLPVVSTNVGGIPYLMEHRHTGMLSDDDDVNAMVANIKALIHDKALAAKLVVNAAGMVQDFDWNIVRAKWHEILV